VEIDGEPARLRAIDRELTRLRVLLRLARRPPLPGLGRNNVDVARDVTSVGGSWGSR